MNRVSTLKCAVTLGALLVSSTFISGFSFIDDASAARESNIAGTRLLRSGRYEEALDSFKQAESSTSDRYLRGQALSDCGECCLKMKRYREAKDYFNQALPLLNGGVRGIGNRDANTALVRLGLAEYGLDNYPAAEMRIKQAIENSLGIWTYNYADLANSATYIQALIIVANSSGHSGERWYQYGVYELSNLIRQGGSRAMVAQIALGRLQSYHDRMERPITPAAQQQFRPRSSSDPYLSSSGQYMPSRARYGLNGTQDQFMANPMRRQAW